MYINYLVRLVSMWFRYAPRKSCSRKSDDSMLARPVKDTDLLLLGSAHSVGISPLGGLLSAMTVHGVTCFELAGTVCTSEPHSLDNAMLSSWSHNALNLKPPAVSWNMIPWLAGPNRNEKLTTKDIQSICSVRRMPRAVSLAKWYRRNLQPQTCRVCQSLWERQLENDYIIHNKITIHALL